MSTLKVVNIQHPSAASATLILDSSGNLALPAGSASTPALQGPSDTNTGLFFPAADTIAFAEGGTEALRIDSSGRVGIGTSSPGAPLHIVSNSSAEGIRLAGRSSDNISSFYFRNNADSSSYGLIQGRSTDFRFTSESGSQPITFHTDQERVRITGAGNVGIGTTNPTSALHIDVASGEPLRFRSQTAGSNYFTHVNHAGGDLAYVGAGGGAALNSGTTSDYAIRANQGALLFGTNGNNERARIDSSGRLLVGTSSSANDNIGGTGYANLVQIVGGATGAGLAVRNTADVSRINIVRSANLATDTEIGSLSFGAEATSVERARIACFTETTGGSGGRGGNLRLYTSADTSPTPTERMRINSGGDIFLISTKDQTTASGANLFIDGTSGVLRRSTSSIKYKTDVETLQDSYADEILKCRPVWYRSTSAYDNQQWGYWGFIAEEVAEVDPRLCFYGKNEDGSLEPEGVQYDRFVPHLLNLIKRQKEQIEAMEARLTALEAQ